MCVDMHVCMHVLYVFTYVYYLCMYDVFIYCIYNIYPNCAYYRDTFFGYPPSEKRSKYETVIIICSCVLKEIPNKLIIFLVPPPPKKRSKFQNVTIICRHDNLHN